MQDDQTNDMRVAAYLWGDMEAQERADFEAELANDPLLREELEHQRAVVRALDKERLARDFERRLEAGQRALRREWWWKILTVVGIILLSLGAVGGWFWKAKDPEGKKDGNNTQQKSIQPNPDTGSAIIRPPHLQAAKQNPQPQPKKPAEELLGKENARPPLPAKIPLTNGQSTGQLSGGMLFEDSTYRRSDAVDPNRSAQGLSPAINLKKYCPPVCDQGKMPMCVAFAICNAMSIAKAIQYENLGKQTAQKIFSASYLYNQIHEEPGCHIGAYLSRGLELAKTRGICQESIFPTDTSDCSRPIAQAVRDNASSYRLASYKHLFDPDDAVDKKLIEIKKSLTAKSPVIVGMRVDKSFSELPLGAEKWLPSGEPQDGHALVVVGYDDTTQTIEVVNSYGPDWCKDGFVKIDYATFGQHLRYGYEIAVKL